MPGPQTGQDKPARKEMRQAESGRVIWLTGLSGAGKSTLAYGLQAHLRLGGRHCIVLDGDHLRSGLCSDLDFSLSGRRENLRRAAEVAKLFAESGAVCIAAFISPMRADREMIRKIVGADRFTEVYLDCSLQACESRDVKGLYKRARAGTVAEFTGVTSPYEPPISPDLILATETQSIDDCLCLLQALTDTTSATHAGS